jgi:hypothetical protein
MVIAQDFVKIQTDALGDKIPVNIGAVITNLLPYIFGGAAIALLIYLIIGGFQMMLSRGDPKAMQAAQAKITNAIIGFVIIVIAFFVVQLLGQLLGIEDTAFGQIFRTK